jgi:pimeloyl-ACP methyl ester carboxylesterase
MRLAMKISFFGVLAVLVISGLIGYSIGGGLVHPQQRELTAELVRQADEILGRENAVREDLNVIAPDGVALNGWKVHPRAPNGDWVLLFHGVADNRAGMMSHAGMLLRHNYSLVMMDSRAHGESGGSMATYGARERDDTRAVVAALIAIEHSHCIFELGESMGAGLALESAAVEPQIAGVVAESPFSTLREVSYDYTGLHLSPLLGRTLFWPASYFGLREMEKAGRLRVDDISTEQAVRERPFPVFLICDTLDHIIPCRHARLIFAKATGPKQLWIVEGADHTGAMGRDPAEFERRTISFLQGIHAGRN